MKMTSSPKGFWSPVPGLSAVDAEWRMLFGDEYALAKLFLRPSGTLASSHPAPSDAPVSVPMPLLSTARMTS